MTPLVLPAFSPDSSPNNPLSTDNALNLLPGPDGWKPMSDFIAASDALPAAPRGLTIARNTDEVFKTFAGTATNLYRANTATSIYTWDEYSKSTDAYSLGSDAEWSWAKFGDYLVAVAPNTPPQVLELISGTAFADLAGSPPRASYVKAVNSFLVLLSLDDATNALQWCGYEDIEHWEISERGADIQYLPVGDEIMGAVDDISTGGLIIIHRSGMTRMYPSTGSTYVFGFKTITGSRGSIAPNSIIEIGGGRFFYLGREGFLEGVESNPIGANRVNEWFFEQADPAYLYNVKASQDPFNTIVWWNYQKTDGTRAIIGYNWSLNLWCHSDADVRYAAGLTTPGIGWDALDDLFDTIDDVNIPYDSRYFKGGSPVWAVFDTDNKLAYAAGANMACQLETGLAELNPGRRTFVRGVRLIGDGPDSSYTIATGGIPIHSDTVAYNAAYSPNPRSGIAPARSQERSHRFKIDRAAGAQWSSMSSLQIDATPEGES